MHRAKSVAEILLLALPWEKTCPSSTKAHTRQERCDAPDEYAPSMLAKKSAMNGSSISPLAPMSAICHVRPSLVSWAYTPALLDDGLGLPFLY